MDNSILTSQVALSAIVVFLLNRIKASKLFPFITTQTATLNRWVAILVSGLVAFGIHTAYTYDHSAGVFTLTLSGLTWQTIVEHGKDWIFSYVVQQTGYQTVGKTEPEKWQAKPLEDKSNA